VPFPFYSHRLPYTTNNIFQKKNLEVIGIGALVRSWIQKQQHVGIFGSNDTDEELRFVCQMAICRDSSKSGVIQKFSFFVQCSAQSSNPGMRRTLQFSC
jgi:hypothetical protein